MRVLSDYKCPGKWILASGMLYSFLKLSRRQKIILQYYFLFFLSQNRSQGLYNFRILTFFLLATPNPSFHSRPIFFKSTLVVWWCVVFALPQMTSVEVVDVQDVLSSQFIITFQSNYTGHFVIICRSFSRLCN